MNKYLAVKGEGNPPPVSIIIPMYNSSKTISRCLESIKCLDYPPEKLEVIVIDDGSIDSSVITAQEYAVTINKVDHRGPSSARNKGVELAAHNIIAFLDSDDVAKPNWIKISVNELYERKVAAVGCCYSLLNTIKNFTKIIWVDQYTRLNKSADETNHLGTSGFVCIKEIFQECGGFDENMYAAEDMLLSYEIIRRHYNIFLIKKELILIELSESPFRFIKKQIRKSAYVVLYNIRKKILGNDLGNSYSNIFDYLTAFLPIFSLMGFILLPPFEFMNLLIQMTLFLLLILLNYPFFNNAITIAKKNDYLNLSWIIMLPLYLIIRSFSWSVGLIYSFTILIRSYNKIFNR